GADVVLPEDFVCADLVGGADLRSDDEVGKGKQFFGSGEAIFFFAYEQGFIIRLIERGEVHRLVAFGRVGDTIASDVNLAIGDGDQHAIPCHFRENRHAVDQRADVAEGVVVPA